MEKKRVILLTGTPALAKPKELYTILKILRPDVLPFFKSIKIKINYYIFVDFGERYCDPKISRWNKKFIDYDGNRNL